MSFTNIEITLSEKGSEKSGTTVTINKSGSYLITGYSSEGNIILGVDKINLYLQNLNLTSKITSLILVNKELKNIKIISLGNVTLNDQEEETNTSGECAVIKIKKKSKIIFTNEKDFKLIGKCKNVIKGGAQVNLFLMNQMVNIYWMHIKMEFLQIIQLNLMAENSLLIHKQATLLNQPQMMTIQKV